MKLKTLFIIIITLFINSCSKEKTIDNDVKRIQSIKLIRTVQIPDSIGYAGRDFCLNSKGDIYILEEMKSKIYRFAQDGSCEVFGAQGSGPGEFKIGLDIYEIKDTVYVFDYDTKELVRFDQNNDFIDKKAAKSLAAPNMFDNSHNGKLIGTKFQPDGNERISCGLAIYDQNLEVTKEINYYKLNFPEFNIFDIVNLFAFNDSVLYYIDESNGAKPLKMLNWQTGKTSIVQTKSSKIQCQKFEIAKINTILKDAKQFGGQCGTDNVNKKPINAIALDKYGCLLIFPSVVQKTGDSSTVIDIYKNNEFIERISLSNFLGDNTYISLKYKIKFFGDLIYVYDRTVGTVKVYDY